ncbi:MAG: hypothetical protein NXH75_08015 [Halobacteriovoraceae bacterium]|nr:hypothetical protein [Halobacteriovoraceae bacterium]
MAKFFFKYFLGTDDLNSKPMEISEKTLVEKDISWRISRDYYFIQIKAKKSAFIHNGLRTKEKKLFQGDVLIIDGVNYYFYYKQFERLGKKHIRTYIMKNGWQALVLIFGFFLLNSILITPITNFVEEKKLAKHKSDLRKKRDFSINIFNQAKEAFKQEELVSAYRLLEKSHFDRFDNYEASNFRRKLKETKRSKEKELFKEVDKLIKMEKYIQAQRLYCNSSLVRVDLPRYIYKIPKYPNKFKYLYNHGKLKSSSCFDFRRNQK